MLNGSGSIEVNTSRLLTPRAKTRRGSRTAETSDKNYVASMRVRVLEEDRDIDRIIVTTTTTDLVDTQARSTDVERGIAGLPGQTDATNTLALLAEGRSVETL
ncbi:hypothetical protein LXL04_003730 [Taraxacum kok-saghyz]